MTDRVHGGIHGGEFLTGKMDFFTIETIVPMAQTNVETPVADLYPIGTVWQSVTIVDGDGVPQTYASQAAYVAAWEKQQNLNTLLNTFALRANPVAVSIASASTDVTGMFGSNYTGSMTVATVNIATEKSGLWYAASQGNFYPGYGEPVISADDSNANGYLLASAMNNVAAYNVGSVLNNDFFVDGGANQNFGVARRVML